MTVPRTFSDVEHMVIAEAIVSADALALADELEGEDLAEPRARAVFTAIRSLQGRGEPVHVLAVGSEMHRIAAAKGDVEQEDTWFIAEAGLLIFDAPRYEPTTLPGQFRAHLRALRALAYQRRLLQGAA